MHGERETRRASELKAELSGLKDACLFGDRSYGFEGLIDLGAGVLTGHDGANAGFTFRNGGEGDASGHDASVEEGTGEVHGAATVADDNRGDRGLALGCGVAADIKSGVGELLLEVRGVGPETVDSLGFGLEDVEGCDAGCRD